MVSTALGRSAVFPQKTHTRLNSKRKGSTYIMHTKNVYEIKEFRNLSVPSSKSGAVDVCWCRWCTCRRHAAPTQAQVRLH